MIKKETLRRLALILSLIMFLTSSVNTTLCVIVSKTEGIINTFVPFESIINNFFISKEIEHPFGDEYEIPEDISFDFKIDFGKLYAKTTIQTSDGEKVADKNGSIQVSVKPDKAFSVKGIDEGTEVTVTEIQKEGTGFTVKDGAATMQGIVGADGGLSFSYINVYSPAPVKATNVTIKGEKILEGRDWKNGDSFSFLLEQKSGEDTWVSLGTKSVSYDKNDDDFAVFEFTDLIQGVSFDAVGTYYFRMTEVLGNLENVDYDKSINTLAIEVTDEDMDGKLEIGNVTADQHATAHKNGDEFNVSVTFNNKFVPAIPDPDDITVKIKIDKTVKNTGTFEIGPENFEFVLENVENGVKNKCKSNIEGDAEILLVFTAKDIGKEFRYKLSETNDGMVGVTYDNRVYDISVAIEQDTSENKLIPVVKIDGNEVQKVVAVFENIYHNMLPVPEGTSVEIEVRKSVVNKGESKIGPGGFEFVLENKETAEKIILTSNSDGTVKYRLPFTAADIGKTFTYTLREMNEGMFGMTYDTDVYEFTVAVTLSADNKLVTSVTVNGESVYRVIAEFENTYDAKKPTVTPTGDRSNLTFWFILALASGTTFILLLLLGKKKKKEKSPAEAEASSGILE